MPLRASIAHTAIATDSCNLGQQVRGGRQKPKHQIASPRPGGRRKHWQISKPWVHHSSSLKKRGAKIDGCVSLSLDAEEAGHCLLSLPHGPHQLNSRGERGF